MVMSVQSAATSTIAGRRPVAPPRKCRKKDSSQLSSSLPSSPVTPTPPVTPRSTTPPITPRSSPSQFTSTSRIAPTRPQSRPSRFTSTSATLTSSLTLTSRIAPPSRPLPIVPTSSTSKTSTVTPKSPPSRIAPPSRPLPIVPKSPTSETLIFSSRSPTSPITPRSRVSPASPITPASRLLSIAPTSTASTTTPWSRSSPSSQTSPSKTTSPPSRTAQTSLSQRIPPPVVPISTTSLITATSAPSRITSTSHTALVPTSHITPASPALSNTSSYDNIDVQTPSNLVAWVSTHPRRVNRSVSETATPWLSSNNHNDKIKTVSLERTRQKGLPPSPVVRMPIRTSKPPAPATIPRLPAKRGLQLSAQKLSDLNTDVIPNLPVKTIPRLPPKEKKEKSTLNSGILNPLDKKETVETILLSDNDIAVSLYEEIKPSGLELVKVTESIDSTKYCNSLPKRPPLYTVEEPNLDTLSLVSNLNTLPKRSSHKPLIKSTNRSLPAPSRGVPAIPKKTERTVLGQIEADCFATPASKFFDLSTMSCKPPSIGGTSCSVSSTSRSNSQKSSMSKRLTGDSNDISLLNDDSYEPDFGHLVLLQGGVEAIQAALQARKEKLPGKKRGDFLSEKSQLTVETDSKLDDAGYEVPASEERNSPNEADPTYEEVTFHYPEGKPRPAARWRKNPKAFFSTIASSFRSRCCACNWRMKASSYRFAVGPSFDWHSSEIPITTKGSRSSEFVSRVRTLRRS